MRFPILAIGVLSIIISSCKRSADNGSIIGSWRVASLLKDGTSTVQNTSDTLLVSFFNDKSVRVQLEINNCEGTFTTGQDGFDISNLGCTEACCDSEFSSDLLYTLKRVDDYTIAGEELNLTGDSDRVIRCTLH